MSPDAKGCGRPGPLRCSPPASPGGPHLPPHQSRVPGRVGHSRAELTLLYLGSQRTCRMGECADPVGPAVGCPAGCVGGYVVCCTGARLSPAEAGGFRVGQGSFSGRGAESRGWAAWEGVGAARQWAERGVGSRAGAGGWAVGQGRSWAGEVLGRGVCEGPLDSWLSCPQLDGGLPEGGAACPGGAGGRPPERGAAGQAGPLLRALHGPPEEDL